MIKKKKKKEVLFSGLSDLVNEQVFRFSFILVESSILKSHYASIIMMFTFQLQFALAAFNSEVSGRVGITNTLNFLFVSECTL